eukprot:5495418-Prymnesium_polylepis.3
MTVWKLIDGPIEKNGDLTTKGNVRDESEFMHTLKKAFEVAVGMQWVKAKGGKCYGKAISGGKPVCGWHMMHCTLRELVTEEPAPTPAPAAAASSSKAVAPKKTAPSMAPKQAPKSTPSVTPKPAPKSAPSVTPTDPNSTKTLSKRPAGGAAHSSKKRRVEADDPKKHRIESDDSDSD